MLNKPLELPKPSSLQKKFQTTSDKPWKAEIVEVQGKKVLYLKISTFFIEDKNFVSPVNSKNDGGS